MCGEACRGERGVRVTEGRVVSVPDLTLGAGWPRHVRVAVAIIERPGDAVSEANATLQWFLASLGVFDMWELIGELGVLLVDAVTGRKRKDKTSSDGAGSGEPPHTPTRRE